MTRGKHNKSGGIYSRVLQVKASSVSQPCDSSQKLLCLSALCKHSSHPHIHTRAQWIRMVKMLNEGPAFVF